MGPLSEIWRREGVSVCTHGEDVLGRNTANTQVHRLGHPWLQQTAERTAEPRPGCLAAVTTGITVTASHFVLSILEATGAVWSFWLLYINMFFHFSVFYYYFPVPPLFSYKFFKSKAHICLVSLCQGPARACTWPSEVPGVPKSPEPPRLISTYQNVGKNSLPVSLSLVRLILVHKVWGHFQLLHCEHFLGGTRNSPREQGRWLPGWINSMPSLDFNFPVWSRPRPHHQAPVAHGLNDGCNWWNVLKEWFVINALAERP